MPDYDNGGNTTKAPDTGLRGLIFRTDHKAIGLQYLWLALFSVFLGMIMSLVMRIHLVWPGAHLPLLSGLDNSPERYAALTLLHGSLMVLMVLTAAPQSARAVDPRPAIVCFGDSLTCVVQCFKIGSVAHGDLTFELVEAYRLWN